MYIKKGRNQNLRETVSYNIFFWVTESVRPYLAVSIKGTFKNNFEQVLEMFHDTLFLYVNPIYHCIDSFSQIIFNWKTNSRNMSLIDMFAKCSGIFN